MELGQKAQKRSKEHKNHEISRTHLDFCLYQHLLPDIAILIFIEKNIKIVF